MKITDRKYTLKVSYEEMQNMAYAIYKSLMYFAKEPSNIPNAEEFFHHWQVQVEILKQIYIELDDIEGCEYVIQKITETFERYNTEDKNENN